MLRDTAAYILIKDRLRPPLDLVPVDNEQELHKQNSRTGVSIMTSVHRVL